MHRLRVVAGGVEPALADAYRASLERFPTLDSVPPQWRHITLQGLGHADEVAPSLDAALSGVADRLKKLKRIVSTFRRAVIFGEAIALPPDNPAAYTELRDAIRAGIYDAWGTVSESADGFRAHASVAYSNGEANARPIRAALDATPVEDAVATFDGVDLIEVHRDERMYEWRVVERLPLGS